jgi:hypothetical protein
MFFWTDIFLQHSIIKERLEARGEDFDFWELKKLRDSYRLVLKLLKFMEWNICEVQPGGRILEEIMEKIDEQK